MTSLRVPNDVQALIASLWNGIQAGQNGKVAEAAKADPSGHKLTRVFEAGMNYRYISAEKAGRGRAFLSCWPSHRNVAGSSLGGGEVVGKKKPKGGSSRQRS